MSFSSDAKAELCRARVDKKCCAIAESYGVLLYCNTFTPREIRIITASDAFAARLPRLFRRAFSVAFDVQPGEEAKGKRSFIIREKDKIEKIFDSFGAEADLVFDARFLPNPFYVDELREKSGLDLPVREYVFSFQQARTFLEQLEAMLEFLIPLYIEEGKLSLTVAIGCTGGRHRSVAIAAALNDSLLSKGFSSVNVNRDIDK